MYVVSTYQGGVRIMYHIRTTWYQLVCTWYEPAPKIRICRYLCNVGKSSTMKARLQEEVRLVEIAQGTRVRYTEMGVCSAVAVNQ